MPSMISTPLLHLRTLRGLDGSEPNFEKGRLPQCVEELLLLPKRIRTHRHILQRVVVVGTKQTPISAQLRHKLSEIEVVPLQSPFQRVIEVATIDENRDSLQPHVNSPFNLTG
jgi:tRNA(Ser,Leu) C12 N-acetylase TAN1